jgi:hypothetical protein
MYKRSLLAALIALPLLTTAGHAQKWDAPMFYSPRPMDDIGLYVFKTHDPFLIKPRPTGMKLIWRQTGNINLGLQAGFGDFDEIGNTILLGAEFGNTLARVSGNGIVAAWDLGAGAVFGSHYVDLGIPLGLSLGLNLGSRNSGLTPYVHPRVSFDVVSYDVSPGVERTVSTVGLAADLGAELYLGETLVVRAAYTLGNDEKTGKRDAFGAGVALRMPRKVRAVR